MKRSATHLIYGAMISETTEPRMLIENVSFRWSECKPKKKKKNWKECVVPGLVAQRVVPTEQFLEEFGVKMQNNRIKQKSDN